MNARFHRFEKAAGGFFSEFWKFAAKGNAIQLAVAVVLGNAFGAIVNSLVNDIITPFITLSTGNVDFNAWSFVLREPRVINGTTTPALMINYGHLLQAIINFLIVGLSIFVIFKFLQGAVQRMQKKEAEKPAEPPTSNEEKILAEIRDILKARQQ
jgi:large conductance mechanosensitive channel